MVIVILLLAIILCVCLFEKNKEPLGDESVQNGTATEEPVAEQSEKQESEQSSKPMAEQSSESASEQTEEPMSEQPSELASEQISEQESDSVPELNLNSELQETDNPYVREYSGMYKDDSGDDKYFYQIPQFIADTQSAQNLNQRIFEEIMPHMGHEDRDIWYEVFEYGDMVSVLVTIPYPNDGREYYAYTYDFANGKEVTNPELLAMYGMTEESFVQKAYEAQEASWEKFLESVPADFPYRDSTYELETAKGLTTPDLPMYLDADGTLKVFVPLPSMVTDWYWVLYEVADGNLR